MKNYTEETAIDSLRSKGVKINNRKVEATRNSLGVKSLGKIDFLKNYKGYSFSWSK